MNDMSLNKQKLIERDKQRKKDNKIDKLFLLKIKRDKINFHN